MMLLVHNPQNGQALRPEVRLPQQPPGNERGFSTSSRSQSSGDSLPSKRMRRNLIEIPCAWPGCRECLAERRLDSDLQAYTEKEFIERYAPGSGVTVRWDRAAPAAAYCEHHVCTKAWLLEEFGLAKNSALRMARKDRLHLHPELDKSVWHMLQCWWDASKELYTDAHPDRWSPPDAQLQIAGIYCFSNKDTDYVGPDGRASTHRWTYDPMSLAGTTAQNRKLLVHGTRFERLTSIIEEDLGMSGMEVDVKHGTMLGKGVYVADSFMKSLQYASEQTVGGYPTKYLLLLEVNMGSPIVCTRVQTEAAKTNREYEQTSGVITRKEITFARGVRFFAKTALLDSGWAKGCRVPVVVSKHESTAPCRRDRKPLMFNEWCIHDTQRFRIRYIVKLTRQNVVREVS